MEFPCDIETVMRRFLENMLYCTDPENNSRVNSCTNERLVGVVVGGYLNPNGPHDVYVQTSTSE